MVSRSRHGFEPAPGKRAPHCRIEFAGLGVYDHELVAPLAHRVDGWLARAPPDNTWTSEFFSSYRESYLATVKLVAVMRDSIARPHAATRIREYLGSSRERGQIEIEIARRH